MHIVTIAGWSGSGKTSLIIKLIKALKGRGKRVMTLKNAPEKYYLEPEGKDSVEFLKAGADTVYLTARNEIMRMESLNTGDSAYEKIKTEFEKYDIVLLEGLIKEGVPIFEVYKSSKDEGLKIQRDRLTAIISDQVYPGNTPFFHRNDIDSILDFIFSD